MFFIISNDKELRADGRAYNELRPIKIEAGVLKRADGSAYLEVGGNKILVAVYGPRESYIRRLLEPNTGVIRCRYNMAPFSVDDRKRPGPDRRSSEISKITADALNVRSVPSMDGKINARVRKNEIYTIIEEKNGFGKLKSGAGWILLEYTKKI